MKKAAAVTCVALVLYFVIFHPVPAANVASYLLSGLRDAADAIITFVKNVFA